MTYEIVEALESLRGLLERKALPIGTTRTWKGKDYIKTEKGWRRVATGRKKAVAAAAKAPSLGSFFDSVASSPDAEDVAYTVRFQQQRGRMSDTEGEAYVSSFLQRQFDTGPLSKAMDKSARELEGKLGSLLGKGGLAQSFIQSVVQTFSSSGATSDSTTRYMNNLRKSAASFPEANKEQLQKAGIPQEAAKAAAAEITKQAQSVSALIQQAQKQLPQAASKLYASMKQ